MFINLLLCLRTVYKGTGANTNMGFLGKVFRRQRDVIDGVCKTSGKKKRLTIRVPEVLFSAMKDICDKHGLRVNEATILLYEYMANQTLEFEIVRRVKKREGVMHKF